jgi:hypothetical protein
MTLRTSGKEAVPLLGIRLWQLTGLLFGMNPLLLRAFHQYSFDIKAADEFHYLTGYSDVSEGGCSLAKAVSILQSKF